MARIDDYKAARALAVAELQKINPKRLAGKSACTYHYDGGQEGVIVPYFGQLRRVDWPEVTVTAPGGGPELPLTEQILILHYLLNTSGEPPTGRTIDFRQVPGGNFYWSAFVSRAKTPLLSTFGDDLAFYLKVAQMAGGAVEDLGDASARFQAFPLVAVTHVLWQGDQEFPPEASILFDENIAGHLPTEDVAALAGASVYRLMGLARQLKTKG
ncbi:MAG: DUF3786 domain-containing protein [Deltaproteobacteria bacterium]|nr:DUF3786 domain-containing protein [Deltaproteobacteria bacterium]